MKFLFWILCVGAVYSYFLYPLALLLLSRLSGRRPMHPVPAPPPRVTLIIAAHNERERIREKLDNSLRIEWPGLEVIVASDCSTDGTDDIVRDYAGRGVRLVRSPQRLGKEYAQQRAVTEAVGDILVFSDSGTSIEPDAVARLVAYFGDPSIGAVSSEDRFVRDDGALVGEGAYVRYEMMVRRLESRLAGLVGLSGSFFAARRGVCEQWDVQAPSDFNTALNCARLGLRAVTAPDVHGFYRDLKDPSREYQRKVRTVIRGMSGLARHPDVLSLRRYGVFAWQIWSHKVMRWLVPVFLIGLLGATVALQSEHVVYQAALFGQMGFYALALAAHRFAALRRAAPIRLVYFFCQVNVAIVQAGASFLTGRRIQTWQPSAR